MSESEAQVTELTNGIRVVSDKMESVESVSMGAWFGIGTRNESVSVNGVAHVLEHTTLCGSKSYPVRDPFFMMLRRSLNTFMNAFTASDCTAYPFATQNRKDFNNLLSVYLDAVFFPLLDPLDFAQEGWRLDFDENDSGLVYKGVVYIEMKGAMSSPDDAFIQNINENLFLKSQYKFNSCGDPQAIPKLNYQELIEFHKKYYHPSNCWFLTYGDLDFTEHLKFIQEQVLANYEKLDGIESQLLMEDSG
mgnify:CR=1 FL=1